MWALAPQTPFENRAHSQAIPDSRMPVESISLTASAADRRKPRPAIATIVAKSPENTRWERWALASAKVEREISRAPTW